MDYIELEEDFFDINNLTVIASESYDSFAKALQTEIAETLSRKSYDKFEHNIFIDKELINAEGKSLPLDETIVNKIYRGFMKNDYIDENDNITYKLKEDIANYSICFNRFTRCWEEYICILFEPKYRLYIYHLMI